jgi:sulfonate transport system ATP-binding protein
VHSVSKRFGEREVLHRLDLTVQEGEMVAIVGKSGCGKSTLLRLLAGLERANEGAITVDSDLVNGRNRSARLICFRGIRFWRMSRWPLRIELAGASQLSKRSDKSDSLTGPTTGRPFCLEVRDNG